MVILKPDFISDYSFFFHSVLSNHTANNHYGRLELDSPGYQTAASLQPLHENSRQEKIEVQILPQVSYTYMPYSIQFVKSNCAKVKNLLDIFANFEID